MRPNVANLYFAKAALAACLCLIVRGTQTISIAHREASMRFSYPDGNKKPIGYAVELCLKLAEAVYADRASAQGCVALSNG